MLISDYHTHTIYSHGKGTIEDNVKAALALGIKNLGISDHGPKHLIFPLREAKFLEVRREIDRLNNKYAGKINVLMGVEANLMGDGITDIPAKHKSLFDFILLGYHKGTIPEGKLGMRWFSELIFGHGRHNAKENALAYVHAMDKHPGILAIAHPNTYLRVDTQLLAREAALRNVALEINDRHAGVGAEEIAAMKSEGAKFIVSSDAHHPSNVGMVSRAIERAKSADVLDAVINYKA